MKEPMKKEDFAKCEICKTPIPVEFDSPLYCEKCIAEMEKLNLSPERYKKEREIEETLKKKK